jgi:small subunit ribosomal protein S17
MAEDQNIEEPQEAPVSETERASETEGETTAPDATVSETDASAGGDVAAEAGARSRPAAEAEAPVAPKERRRRARASKAAAVPTRPPRSPEERQADRLEERRRKAQLRSARRKHDREKARARRADSPAAGPLEPRREQHPGQQKTRQGIVVSDRASKTIVVRIDVTRRHPRYEKIVRTSRTLHAHDEREDAHVGDTVIVRESRPLSRSKRWRLVEVVERAK